MKRNGFTLAEVLITLGILGVVAALSMPVISSSTRNAVNASKLSVAISEYENAFGLMLLKEDKTDLSETEYGIALAAGNSAAMETALAKYMKLNNVGTSMSDFGYTAHIINPFVGAAYAEKYKQVVDPSPIPNPNPNPNPNPDPGPLYIKCNEGEPQSQGDCPKGTIWQSCKCNPVKEDPADPSEPSDITKPSESNKTDPVTNSSGSTQSTGGMIRDIRNGTTSFNYKLAAVSGNGSIAFFVGNTATIGTMSNARQNGVSTNSRFSTMYIDVNGVKSPNQYGRDVFEFVITGDGHIYPYGSKAASYLLGETKIAGCNGASDSGLGCTARLVNNNYKVDY